ncbi:hypothetical protein LWI28_013338 [Acer negundo]|uniref:Uncharacterized protein n=1 Tax=Acer negundo TaxID=4023 RepID=A0AAD5JKK1_ACENE|nr:hypothetical protein LWI28_013338 [Acer negundo]
MADRGKGDADKKKEKKKRVISTGLSLINKGESSGPEPPPKRMRTADIFSSVTISKVPSKIMVAIPLTSLPENVPGGYQTHIDAIDNLLQLDKRYAEKRGRYEKLKKEKDKVDDKLREALASIESQKATISEMSISYRKAKSRCSEKRAKLCDYCELVKRANETTWGMKEDLRNNTAIESLVKEERDPVKDIYGDFMEEPVSDDEHAVVSSDDERFSGGNALGKGKRVRRS